jgi:hypothetical protein
LFYFFLASGVWSKIQVQGSSPAEREGAVSSVFKNLLVITGGRSGSGVYSDVLLFNTSMCNFHFPKGIFIIFKFAF